AASGRGESIELPGAEDGLERRSPRRTLLQARHSVFIFFVAFCRIGRGFALNHVFERPIEISVEGVRSTWVCGQIAPMFVHPKPGRWVLSHIWFKRVPTCLRDLLMGHPICVADLRVEDKPVTPIRQWFAVRGYDRDASAFAQPRVSGSH